MTFYLKYRPQNLNDLDQEEVRNSLIKIVKSKNIPHAFLFSGPKGTGKTSAARILAKIINCESSSDKLRGKDKAEPCNECEQCLSITKGQNIDVIEIDAASHRGIEDIRMIRDAVKLSPAKARMKVYIIDEAHMLTTEASNALLKTLEEPPDHVVFILATTNPEKLIDTVRSRVTTIAFKKATKEEIARSLDKIAKKENIKISDKFLEEIVNRADGSFRDATKILEQMVIEGADFNKDPEDYFGSRFKTDSGKFISLIAKKDTKVLLTLVEESVASGVGAYQITSSVLEKLRNILLTEYNLREEVNKEKLSKDNLINLIKLFSEALVKIPNALIEQLPLEIAIIEWCESEASIDQSSNGTKTVKVEKKEEIITSEKVEISKETKRVNSDAVKVNEEINTEEVNINNSFAEISRSSLTIDDKVWREVLTKVRPGHTSTEALLRAAKPLEFNGSVLKLGVYYKFHKERLEEKQHRDILEEALQIYLGSPVRVVCTLTEPPSVNNQSDEPEVVLEEPKKEVAATAVLTGGSNQDIISLAEKIFSN